MLSQGTSGPSNGSARSSSGTCIAMEPDSVYNFLTSLQSPKYKKTYNSDVKLLSGDDLKLPFVAREDAIEQIAECFKERIVARNAKVSACTHYPIPACAWIPGLGKTRLLHQGKEILHRSGVTGRQIHIIVPYLNGHSLQWIDKELSIECSFAWRLLFMVFLKWRGPEFADFCSLKVLPFNCHQMNLSVALQTVRVGLMNATKNPLDKDEMLNIFVGIDDFESIAEEKDKQREHLTELCSKLHDNSFKRNISMFPLFAGTDWGLMRDVRIAPSLSVKSIPLAPLDYEQATVLFEAELGEDILINSPLAAQHLLSVSSLPKTVLDYCKGICEVMSSDGATVPSDHHLIKAYNEVLKDGERVWNSPSMLAKLVAFCFTMEDVGNHTAITYLDEKAKERKASVLNLSNLGFCLTTVGIGGQYVEVPYMVIHLFARCVDQDMKTATEKHLLRTVQWLVANVDQVLHTKPACQLFADFSAAFTACRINSWLVLGHGTASINDLWRGGVSSVPHDVRVKLLPVSVVKVTELLDSNAVTGVYSTDKSQRCGYVVRNDENDKAVDNWSTLPLEYTNRLDQDTVTFLEQTQLKDTAILSLAQVTEFSCAMKSIFETADSRKKTMVVSCLRNPLARLEPNVADNLPHNSVVIVRDHLRSHFGMFHRHPAVSFSRAGGGKRATKSASLAPYGIRRYSTLQHAGLSGRVPNSHTSFVFGAVRIVKALLKLRW